MTLYTFSDIIAIMKFERDDLFTLSPLVDDQGRHYSEKPDGHIDFGDVSRTFLGKQCQYGSDYINGTPEKPNLGAGLRFNGDLVNNYHSIGIHPEDIEEFVYRYYGYLAFIWGYVEDESGVAIEIPEVARETLYNYLVDSGVNEEILQRNYFRR